MRKIEWKIGEPGSEAVVARNLRMMDELFRRLETRCANELCQYPLSALRQERFAVPEFGEVCATCHGMYSAVSFMNPNLTKGNYFKDLHDAWLREIRDFKDKRKRMGE